MPTVTRRNLIHTVGAVVGGATLAARRTAAAITYTVDDIREFLDGQVYSPNQYSYDAYEWNGTAVLEFEDSEYIEFGNDNDEPTATPTATPSVSIERDGITLPMQINLKSMQTGVALFLIGVLALEGGASVLFRNPAAGIMAGLCVVLLIASGLFGVGLQIFWLGVIITALLLVVGIAARWST